MIETKINIYNPTVIRRAFGWPENDHTLLNLLETFILPTHVYRRLPLFHLTPTHTAHAHAALPAAPPPPTLAAHEALIAAPPRPHCPHCFSSPPVLRSPLLIAAHAQLTAAHHRPCSAHAPLTASHRRPRSAQRCSSPPTLRSPLLIAAALSAAPPHAHCPHCCSSSSAPPHPHCPHCCTHFCLSLSCSAQCCSLFFAVAAPRWTPCLSALFAAVSSWQRKFSWKGLQTERRTWGAGLSSFTKEDFGSKCDCNYRRQLTMADSVAFFKHRRVSTSLASFKTGCCLLEPRIPRTGFQDVGCATDG
jgi:hypothetical protein